MTAINHALTGSVIGALVGGPLALPLALMSHFGLDALPHFGNDNRFKLHSRAFWLMLTLDLALVAALVVYLWHQPEQATLMIGCLLLALSPDFMHLRLITGYGPVADGRIYRWHRRIQRSETPSGIVIELIWLAGMGFVLVDLLHG